MASKLLQPKCELASSQKCNVLEAINLVAATYSIHNQNRSLIDTGHSIILLTCGEAIYHTDSGLYKIAKLNLLLNNTSCIMISFKKESTLKNY